MSKRDFTRGAARWGGGSDSQWSARKASPVDPQAYRDLATLAACEARLPAGSALDFVQSVSSAVRMDGRPLTMRQRFTVERICARCGADAPARPVASPDVNDGRPKPMKPPTRERAEDDAEAALDDARNAAAEAMYEDADD